MYAKQQDTLKISIHPMIFNTSMVCKGRTEKGVVVICIIQTIDKIVSNVTLQNNKLYNNKNPFLYSSIKDLPRYIFYHLPWKMVGTIYSY